MPNNPDTEIIERWLYGRPSPTQKAYLRDVTRALSWMGDPAIADVTLAKLQDYQAHLFHQLRQAPGTVNRKMSALRSLLRFAHEQEYIERNPALWLRSPKVEKNLHERILTTEQVRKIFESAPLGRDRVFLKTVYATGARASELCGAKAIAWKDFRHRSDGNIDVMIFATKTNSWRSVGISPSVWIDIESLRGEALSTDKVFPFDRKRGHEIMKAAATKAGIPNASLHWMRHSRISHLLEAGAPLPLVRDEAGHSNISTTDVYSHNTRKESGSDYLSL
ncbi:MAG: tyrosine-type recombinase/integrase [Cyanobacteria bacterium P01_D01_bin.115]